ncbi:MAG: VOC family protein, partial [Gammaproteobacteria bacterium]
MKRPADYTSARCGRSASPDSLRRRLLQFVALAPVSSLLQAQPATSAIAVRKLHTFGLRVSDVERSVAFYQRLFGMPVQARQGETVCLRIGDGPRFMSL